MLLGDVFFLSNLPFLKVKEELRPVPQTHGVFLKWNLDPLPFFTPFL